MCGIAGFSGHFDTALLNRMHDLIAHRGPDDEGVMVAESQGGVVGFAHRRLSIIDLSPAGHQPMGVCCARCGVASPTQGLSEGLAIIYNGELYNYQELRSGLQAKGHHFHSGSDTEVLLHLYAEEGPRMLQSLNGIFAFALYDGRATGQPEGMERGDVLIARDGLGVKPLYFAETSSGLLFASELKAILASPEVSRELDLPAIHYYVAYLWAPAPFTPIRGVRKLPPGTAMIVRRGRNAKSWSFYDLPYGQPWLTGSRVDIAAEVRERIEGAVKRQLISDVPVGAFLSGGLDSSTVVSIMRKLRSDDPVECYTIGFGDASMFSEENVADLPYAQLVAKYLGVNLNVVQVGPEMMSRLPQMLYQLDEPQADPAPINAMLIAERARNDGIRVLMSGAGGDDIFSGYRRHLAVRMERLWSWLPEGVRSLLAGASATVSSLGLEGWMRNPIVRRASKLFAFADMTDEERMVSYFFWNTENLRRSLYSSEMVNAVGGVRTAGPLLESLSRIPNEMDRLNRMLYLEGKHFLADHNLNYTDKTSMAFGVEVRVPLLDQTLVEFAARIPPRMKQRGGMGKAVLRDAMTGRLPQEIIQRHKTGFGAPLRRWLHSDLKGLVTDLLCTSSLNNRGLFDPEAVAKLLSLDRQGKVDGAYTLFSVICIELWCRMFLDSASPDSFQ